MRAMLRAASSAGDGGRGVLGTLTGPGACLVSSAQLAFAEHTPTRPSTTLPAATRRPTAGRSSMPGTSPVVGREQNLSCYDIIEGARVGG
jgi:hypothetical protein